MVNNTKPLCDIISRIYYILMVEIKMYIYAVHNF